MKFHKLHRMYLDIPIIPLEEQVIILDKEQINYLINVLRCKDCDKIRVFNEKQGEYLATLSATKNKASIKIEQQLRSITSTNHNNKSHYVTLAQCIIKPERMARIIDMATQIGVNKIIPIHSEYSQRYKFNVSKYQKIAIEACRQSERLNIPIITHPITLDEFLQHDVASYIIFANERARHKQRIPNILGATGTSVLIGPEGGFSDLEFMLLKKYKKVRNIFSVSLGINILRSETAATCLLAHLLIFNDVS